MRRILIAVAMLAAASCSKPASTASQIRVAVGGQAQLIYSPVTMAQVLGYTKEENLDVTILDFPGGSKALEALLGGSTDVVNGFYDHTIQMAAQGRQLRSFVTLMRYPGLVLVAISPSVQKIEDLRGKTVGVSSPGSSTHLMVNYLLMQHGLKTGDISVASIGMGTTAVAAASRATVDAAVMTDPSLAIARKKLPSIRILSDTRNAEGVRAAFGVDAYPASVLYSSAAWLDGHRDEAARLSRAVHKTLEWMRSHSPEEILAKLPAGFRTDDAETDLAGIRSLQEMLSRDGKMDPASPEAVRKVLATSIEAVRTAKIDLAATYTNEFAGR